MFVFSFSDFEKQWKTLNFDESRAGNFGTSVTSYFRFLKWLLGLNVFVTLLLLGVLVFTQVFMEPKDFADSLTDGKDQSERSLSICCEASAKIEFFAPLFFAVNRTRFTVKAQNCSKVYESFVEGTINNHSAFDQVLDFFSGTVSLISSSFAFCFDLLSCHGMGVCKCSTVYILGLHGAHSPVLWLLLQQDILEL